jgi:glucuronate isomerase
MKTFLGKDWLLESEIAERLYYDCADGAPIIDYHCHLPPEEILENKTFDNLTKVWLDGDHYKWRAMRANGINEKYITGDASDREKFQKWAETVPYTMRNPLYHWTHLELQRYFGIDELLNASSADRVFDKANDLLQESELSVRGMLCKMNVKFVGTTDDPIDDLKNHQEISKSDLKTIVVPTFRPDKSMDVSNPEVYNSYLDKLEKASGIQIQTLDNLLEALDSRMSFFDNLGCKSSDHGFNQIPFSKATTSEVQQAFEKVRSGKELAPHAQEQLRSYILLELAKGYHARGWAQQYHLGALRNTNRRGLRELGPDTGFDSIGDFDQATSLSGFLNELNDSNQLAKTILYNLNPRDNEVFATMVGNYNDGNMPGKMQFGSGWWFLDQKEGMINQINALSNMGLLSRFIGMLTDSRSFLSFPRHEYFRRILCNLIGQDVVNGELPNDVDILGTIVKDICHRNAENYFDITR